MSMSLTAEICGRVTEYITGTITLEQFDAWYAPETWDVRWDEDGEATAMVHAIDELLAQYTDGNWREDELRVQLQEALKLVSRA
jgi:hypothetical protein